MPFRIKKSPPRNRRGRASQARLRVVTPADELSLGHRRDPLPEAPKTAPARRTDADAILRRLRDLARAATVSPSPAAHGAEGPTAEYLRLLDEITCLGGGEAAAPKSFATTVSVREHVRALDRDLALASHGRSAEDRAQAARARALDTVNQLRVHMQNVHAAHALPRDIDFAVEAAKLTAWTLALPGTSLRPQEGLEDYAALSLLR